MRAFSNLEFSWRHDCNDNNILQTFLFPRLTYDLRKANSHKIKMTLDLTKTDIYNRGLDTNIGQNKQLRTSHLYFVPEEMWRIVALLFVEFAFLDAVPQQDVFWRDYVDGHIPEDALFVETGIYVGQMPMNGALPGTIYAEKKFMVTECCAGRKQATMGVKILCTGHPEDFWWEYINISKVEIEKSDDFVRGGYENDLIMYIGKVFHEGEWKIGKIYPTSHRLRGLRIWDSEGDVYVAGDFQILKYKKNERSLDVRPTER